MAQPTDALSETGTACRTQRWSPVSDSPHGPDRHAGATWTQAEHARARRAWLTPHGPFPAQNSPCRPVRAPIPGVGGRGVGGQAPSAARSGGRDSGSVCGHRFGGQSVRSAASPRVSQRDVTPHPPRTVSNAASAAARPPCSRCRLSRA